MAAVKAGDRVIIANRDVTADDTRTGLYYSYFGGLIGTVDRTYDDSSVCVEIDLDSLSEDTRKRHTEMQEAEKQRWLGNLSDEARNRLSGEQKQLKISYKILISQKDLSSYKGQKPSGSPAPKTDSPKYAPADEPTSKRLSESDLEAAEEAFLNSRRG